MKPIRGQSGTRRRAALTATGLSGLAMFASVVPMALDEKRSTDEHALFARINSLPSGAYPVLNVMQQAGSTITVGSVALCAHLMHRTELSKQVIAAGCTKVMLERTIKAVVPRQRPGTSVPDAVIRGRVPRHGRSFVSGHAMNISLLAVLLGDELRPPWNLLPVALVPMVAFTRVYVGAHTPTDVIGGIGLGTTIGSAFALARPAHDVPGHARQDHCRREHEPWDHGRRGNHGWSER